MRKLDQDGLKELAISVVEEVAKMNPRRIVILTLPWYPGEPFPEVVLHVQVCEKETPTRWRDVNGWMERLMISMDPPIRIRQISDSEEEYIGRVINAMKNSARLQVSMCVRVLKKMSDHEEIVKLFDRLFFLKSPYEFTNVEGDCFWLHLCGKKGLFNSPVELHELERNEVLALLL